MREQPHEHDHREPDRGDVPRPDPNRRVSDRRQRDPRRPGERRTRTWSPWLVIRYKDDDLGSRPIPKNTVFWASPDIEVKSSVAGKAVAGEPNTVIARVINLGKADARPTRADFYWGDPSLGFSPAQMNYIGTRWKQADAHRATLFECPTPWIPITVNGGHECLFVNCTSDILNDKLKHPFQPQLDRHVGQRNVTVINAPPGKTLPFWVMVNNIAPMMATTTIGLRTAHLAMSRDARSTMAYHDIVTAAVAFRGESTARGLFRQVSEGGGFARSAPMLRSELSARRGVMPSLEGRRYFANLMANMSATGAMEDVEAQGGAALHQVTMDAFEQRRLDLELGVPANAQAGDFVMFHLTQSLAGLTVGGYTVVVGV